MAGRTREHLTPKGLATRERILQAAGNLIVSDASVSLDSVRKAASVSGSQLEHYFTDKTDLLCAVIGDRIEAVLDFHRQPRLGGLKSLADFERWATLCAQQLGVTESSTAAASFHVLAAHLGKSDEPVRDALAIAYDRWAGLLTGSIEQMRHHSVLVPDTEARHTALAVLAAHQGGSVMASTFGAPWPLEDATRFAVNHLRLFATDPAERSPRPASSAPQTVAVATDDGDTSRLTRKGVATRAHIVDAAARLMFTGGVRTTSIDEVRAAAGVSGSQVSHYFRDKCDLTRQVITRRRADVVAFHRQSQLGALDSLDVLREWAALCEVDAETVYRRGGCVFGSLAGELLGADDGVRGELVSGYQEWLDLFETGLTQMRARGELCDDADPRHLSTALVAAHQGGAMLTHVTGDTAALHAALGAAIDYVASFVP